MVWLQSGNRDEKGERIGLIILSNQIDIKTLGSQPGQAGIEDWRLKICGILSILFRLHRQKSKNQIMDTQPGEAETKILLNDE